MIKQTGKIGIFDSGLGGLTILKEVVKLMPHYEYIYLGDNLNAPYGDRSPKEIFKLTLAGVEWLFENGAMIAVLACNTASANALRKIQQEILPSQYPDRKVLGIIIPTIEEIEKFSESGYIGILATKATVNSAIYEIEMRKQNPKIQIISQDGGVLAGLIEKDCDEVALLAEIKEVTDKLLFGSKSIDTVILGCTHYALITKEIGKMLPTNIRVVEQGKIVAAKLFEYLNKHDEIRSKLSNSFSLNFYTTGDSMQVEKLATRFYGENISISTVIIKQV
ncbi:MAG TPA: glutamate racemase [Candidatus Moranbacteria bacterium]|nr:glutamate racemase [Candidatus Moranbacteria bacterium]